VTDAFGYVTAGQEAFGSHRRIPLFQDFGRQRGELRENGDLFVGQQVDQKEFRSHSTSPEAAARSAHATIVAYLKSCIS
jgi:hypothetical protein